jgi:hypothetical protein
MLLIILVIVIVAALIYAFSGDRDLNRNERLYLKSRGYNPPLDAEERTRVSKDAHLLGVIESLSDISPFARLRAAEDISRMCTSGQRDPRMLPALITALDDSDASVRSAVAVALGNLGDPASVEPLKKRREVEESIHVRVPLERAIERLATSQ